MRTQHTSPLRSMPVALPGKRRVVPQLVLWLLVLAFLLAACGTTQTEKAVPPLDTSLAHITPARTPHPDISIPAIAPPAPAPIRPGCGDYRLLITVKSDAVGFGARVTAPENAVDIVWNLAGPGLHNTFSGELPAPRVFNEDNREIFGIEANEAHDAVIAQFILLVSGVQPGQKLVLEMGQDTPGKEGTIITVANTTKGLNTPTPVLATVEMQEEYRTLSIDVCAAQPMPLPENRSMLPPKVLSFYYPWWSTEAEAEPPHQCGGDLFAWLREVNGKRTIVTGHLPIAQDGEETIYTQTACWQPIQDEYGRSGMAYDVQDVFFLAEQMALAKAYGIDGFAVSVHGDSPAEMDFLRQKALPVADQMAFTIAPLYEAPETGWDGDEQADIEKLGHHLRELVESLAGHPSALTIEQDGEQKVVIFVDPAALWRFTSPEAWSQVRDIINQANIPHFLWSGPGAFAWVFTTGFDGVYNDLEVVETLEAPLGLPPYALRDERRLAYRATYWHAREQNMALALPVVLGWEGAEALRDPEYVPLPRDYGAPGDLSTYYRTRWEDALEQFPDWILITSWNEWVEGTELEPSDIYPPSRFDYLQATWTYICAWHGCP